MIRPGDILLVYDGRSILARGITAFMRRYCRLNGYKYDRLYHHAAIAVNYQGRTMIAEAVGRGWVIHSPEKAYSEREYRERVDIYRPRVEWTPREIIALSNQAVEYSMKITRYDFANFYFQMVMIQTGVWIGPTGGDAEGRLYCSEGVATIINKIRPWVCEEPWRYNPMDLYLEEHLTRSG